MNKTEMDAFELMLNCQRRECPTYDNGCLLQDRESYAEDMFSPEAPWGSEACEALEHEISKHG